MRITYKYDKNGNNIELIGYDSDGSVEGKITYKYDEQGNPIEGYLYNLDGSLAEEYTSQYEYDEQKNWTKKIEFRNDVPQRITEREYQYYE